VIAYWRRNGLPTVATFAAFFAIALCSLLFTKVFGRVAAVWPANAFLLVTLLRAPPESRLPRAIAAWVANVTADLLTGDRLISAVMLSSLNLLEAGLCAYALRRWVGEALDLSVPRHLLRFIPVALAVPLATAVPAGVFIVSEGLGAPAETFIGWWSAKALGLLIFAPAALILSQGAGRELLGPALIRRTLVMAGVLLAGLSITFLQTRLPFFFLVPPILVLVTFQLGLAGAAWAILITALFSMIALFNGLGPTMLVAHGLGPRVQMLQLFLAFMVVTTLPLVAVLTNRRRLEHELHRERDASKDLANALAEARTISRMADQMAGVGYWTFRPDTGERTWSEEMYTHFGFENDGCIPNSEIALDRYHPEDRAIAAEFVGETLQTGENSSALRLNVGGEFKRVMVRAQRVTTPDNSTLFLGTITDITATHRAEMAMAESEARYRELADLVPDMVVRMTAGRLTYASPACREYGYEPQDLVGRSILEFVHPDDHPDVVERARATFGGVPLDPQIRRTMRIRTASGDWVRVEGNPRQVRNSDGEVTEVINVFRNVTAQHGLELQLREARLVAERAAQTKADFMSNMSHELRTPLTAIVGFAGLLKLSGGLDDKQTIFADRIDKSGKTLLRLVNDILDFSKIEADGVVLEAVAVDLGEVTAEALSLVSAQAEGKGLRLEVDLGSAAAPFLGDTVRLRQVLVNLLGNAVKFTDRGQVALTVRKTGKDTLRFAVTDTGAGIAPERTSEIFDRYIQADGSTTRTHGGTGLGLAICKGLVEAMGGEIGVESVPGKGSTFWFTIRAPTVARTARVRSVA
jgi:PAS domain S-box-containing protein